jgi:hypothetical protein
MTCKTPTPIGAAGAPDPLPDDADVLAVTGCLEAHGIHHQQAEKLAASATPQQVRQALAQALPYRDRAANWPGYLASLLVQLVERDRARQTKARAEAWTRQREALEAAKATVKAWPDAQLRAAVEALVHEGGEKGEVFRPYLTDPAAWARVRKGVVLIAELANREVASAAEETARQES